MNNAEKFKQIFGLYATELWSMPEGDFLEWLNRDVETTQIDHTADIGKKVDGDCISRQAAIDALHMHLMYRMGTDSNKKRLDDWINGLPSAQETHEERTKTHACDLIDRQAALDAIMGQPPEPHYPSWYAAQIEKLPAAQPDRAIIDDCLHHIYKNISVHTATGGVITIKHYMQVLYEEIYGEGERPWWMT